MTRNPYEIERFNLDRDARLTALDAEHVRGQRCPDCGGEIELAPSAMAVEVVCTECHWFEEVA